MRTTTVTTFFAFIAVGLVGCGTSSKGTPPADGADSGVDAGALDAADPEGGTPDASSDAAAPAPAKDGGPIGGDRPVTVHVPPGYVAGSPAPLVILLHGYGASGEIEDYYLKITAESDARGFLYAHPDGTIDSTGKRGWNGTDACCDFDAPQVDDSAYLNRVIEQIEERYTVDPKRVFFVGHSNGGFMSHRMACDHADKVAAIVSLAGAQFSDLSKCTPSGPVAVLEIHGTADDTILFGGGETIPGHAYPGAATTISDWASLDGCSATADTSSPALDLERVLAGKETTVTKYATGIFLLRRARHSRPSGGAGNGRPAVRPAAREGNRR